MSLHTTISSPPYIYDYTKANYNGLSMYLSSCDFTACFHFSNDEEVWAIIYLLVRHYYNYTKS